jgi:hypothetical protein
MLGTISFEDLKGKVTKASISGIIDKTKLATLVTSLDSYSNAKITGYSVVDPAAFAGTTQADGVFPSVEQKVVLTFRYIDADGDKHYVKLMIPAPADSMMQEVEKVGWRPTLLQGQAIAALLSTATGRTMTYTRGTALARPTQSQL